MAGSAEISQTAKQAIEDSSNNKYVSIASLWEISIKMSLDKLSIKGSYESTIDDIIENGFEVLPILFTHTVLQNKLAFYHKDPFDRMIIAQAIVEKMNVVGRDELFDNYFENTDIKRIW